MPQYVYQHNFSKMHRDAVHDTSMRSYKARKTLAVIADWAGGEELPLGQLRLLDVGSSVGYLTRAYAKLFGEVIGIDIDGDAVAFARDNNDAANLHYLVGDSMRLPFPDSSVDVVTCSQVYEHVPDAQQLMNEIYRVLKPGGACYFAAGNRFVLIEMHYGLPLLAAIPKPLAHLYLRALGRGSQYYETHLSYRGLKQLAHRFELIDYTLRVIREPERFSLTEIVKQGSLKQRVALAVLPYIYWLSPTYIWVLRKPRG